jgi:RNA polymerase sigma-70 factor (ECF subfamily)
MPESDDRIYDRLLVVRCQAGDVGAFEELVSRYDRRLAYFVRTALGHGHDAEDVMQEVWLDVHRGLPRLADAGALAAWLYRVARDRASRHRRGRGRPAMPLPEDDIAAEPADEEFTAEDAAAVREALRVLPPEHREVLTLRFLEGMTYDEIARVVDRPLGTVRSRLYHAKRALRRALEAEVDDDGREGAGQGAAGPGHGRRLGDR